MGTLCTLVFMLNVEPSVIFKSALLVLFMTGRNVCIKYDPLWPIQHIHMLHLVQVIILFHGIPGYSSLLLRALIKRGA